MSEAGEFLLSQALLATIRKFRIVRQEGQGQDSQQIEKRSNGRRKADKGGRNAA